MRHWRSLAPGLFAAGFVASCTHAAFGQTTRPTSPDEIAQLVKRIAAPSYRKREQVLRQIAEVGPAAVPYLRREVNSPKQEIALAARELMEELEEVFFCGVSVRLEVDSPRIRWDQPLRLRVVLENRGAFESRIPWWIGAGSTTRPVTLADRAGMVLDVGEFLEVTSPSNEPVELRVDPICDDRDVQKAVEGRARDGGVTSRLAPGKSCVLELPEFNRGWARYAFLAKGRYRMRFVYQPEWTRQEWIEEGLGQAVSNTVEIDVTDAAPQAVRKATGSAAVSVVHDGRQLVARLRNTWDRPLCVNLNFGADTERFAQVGWSILSEAVEPATVIFPPAGQGGGTEPAASRIRLLQPDEEIEIARVEVSALLGAAAKEHPLPAPASLRVTARYVAHGTRESLRQIGEKGNTPAHLALREWAEKHAYVLLTGAPQSARVPLVAKGAATSPSSR